MYKFFRNIHLALGLAITPFLFIYAFSALVFSHHFLNDKTIDSRVETFKLASFSGDTGDTGDLLVALATEHGVRGELKKNVVDDKGRVELLMSRLGSNYEISVDPKTLLLTIEEKTQSVEEFIKALHKSSGFDSASSAERWWGLAVIIVAVLLTGILVTGVVLWSYNRRERRSGLAFLGLSLVYCTIVLVVLRFA